MIFFYTYKVTTHTLQGTHIVPVLLVVGVVMIVVSVVLWVAMGFHVELQDSELFIIMFCVPAAVAYYT